MTKQSFPIPEGCKAVTVEQVGNQIITTFEPVFKRGDVLIYDKRKTLCIFKQYTEDYEFESYTNNTKLSDSFWAAECFRHAAPEEAQRLWDALAKKGKRWNPETMQVEELKKERWRAEHGENYYYIYSSLRTGNGYELEYGTDDIRHEKGNYFQTEEQAQRAANRLQAELDKFWEEELK